MSCLCPLPFKEIFVFKDQSKPCCEFIGSMSYSSKTGNDKLTQIKQQLIDNEFPDGCIKCKTKEKAMGHSLRLSSLSTYTLPDNITADYTGIERISIDTGNVCNLLCLPCNGYSSYNRGIELNKINSIKVIQPYADSDLQRFLNVNFTNLTLSGGEPFADKVSFAFLDQLVTAGRSKNIDLQFTESINNFNLVKNKSVTSTTSIVMIKLVFESISSNLIKSILL